MKFTITLPQQGQTVRAFIQQNLHVSSKMLKYLKYRPDGICVNGERVTVRYVLQEGDVLTLATEDTEENHKLEAVDLPLEILYEDEDVVVPAKPANMPTHPSCDHHDDTVANALAYRYAPLGKAFVFRPIQRLDRNTSGLLLIARNKIAAGKLAISMKNREIHKSYLALLDGIVSEDEGEIDAPLHRTAQSVILREVCSPDAPDADAALTRFRVLARGKAHTLVEASPITGRTHQLRVHFAHLGHPITGDDLYGTPSPLIDRHALHAHTLSFPHPTTEQPLTLSAPIPEDLRQALEQAFPDGSWKDAIPNS